jgi:hypothetical protein
MLTLTQDIAASDNQTSRNQDTTRSQNATHEGGTRGGAENAQQNAQQQVDKHTTYPQPTATTTLWFAEDHQKIIKPQYKQYPHQKKPFVYNTRMVFGGVGDATGGVGATSAAPAGSGSGVARHARERLPPGDGRPCGTGCGTGWCAHAKGHPLLLVLGGVARGGAASGQCRRDRVRTCRVGAGGR